MIIIDDVAERVVGWVRELPSPALALALVHRHLLARVEELLLDEEAEALGLEEGHVRTQRTDGVDKEVEVRADAHDLRRVVLARRDDEVRPEILPVPQTCVEAFETQAGRARGGCDVARERPSYAKGLMRRSEASSFLRET